MSLYYQIDVLEKGQQPLTFNTTTLVHTVTTKDGWVGSDVESDVKFRAELRSIKTHRHFEAEIAESYTSVIHKHLGAINRTTEFFSFNIHLVKESSRNNTSDLMTISMNDVQVKRYHVSKNGYIFAFLVAPQSTPPDDWEF